MKRKLHFSVSEVGKAHFGFEVVTDLSDIDITELLNGVSQWKSVEHDGLPKCDQLYDLLLYSKSEDVLCAGLWSDGEFEPDDGSLYYLKTEKSISHYMPILKPCDRS
jgi:hypothetical protein